MLKENPCPFPHKKSRESARTLRTSRHRIQTRELLLAAMASTALEINCVTPYTPAGFHELRVIDSPNGNTATQSQLNLRLPRYSEHAIVDDPTLQLFVREGNSGKEYRFSTALEVMNGITLQGEPVSLNTSLSLGAQIMIPLSNATGKAGSLPTFYAAPFLVPIISIPLSDPKLSRGFSSVLVIPYLGTEFAANPWSETTWTISPLGGFNISLSSPTLRIGGGMNIPIPEEPKNWSYYGFIRSSY